MLMLAFSGEFVNTDGLSGQVNPATSNKDPQSISKPIAFSNTTNCSGQVFSPDLLSNCISIESGLPVKA